MVCQRWNTMGQYYPRIGSTWSTCCACWIRFWIHVRLPSAMLAQHRSNIAGFIQMPSHRLKKKLDIDTMLLLCWATRHKTIIGPPVVLAGTGLSSLSAHSIRLWLETRRYWVRIPVGSNVSDRGWAYLYIYIYSVPNCSKAWRVQCRLWYYALYMKKPWSHLIRVGHTCSPDFGCPSVTILPGLCKKRRRARLTLTLIIINITFTRCRSGIISVQHLPDAAETWTQFDIRPCASKTVIIHNHTV